MLNWTATKEEHEAINEIVNRVQAKFPGINRMNYNMDVAAAHLNGNALDLSGLLAAKDFDFWHDINGIVANINRANGKLGNCFVPRYSKGSIQTSLMEVK